jgi:hypothetical protein
MKDEVTIHEQYAGNLRDVINSAMLSVRFFAVAPAPVDALRRLLLKARAGVAVTLIVPSSYLNKVGLTDRYQAKFTTAGGRFFLVDMKPADWQRIKIAPRSLVLVDDQKVWQPSDEEGIWWLAPDRLLSVRKQLDLLQETGTMPGGPVRRSTDVTGWRTTAAPLSVTFRAEASVVRSGEQLHLHWSAPGATSVYIQPWPGRVQNFGSRSLQIQEPTEFTLTARRDTSSVAKVLKVDIDRQVSLTYYLTANDPLRPNTQSRLQPRSDMPGFFGVLSGVSLTLHWRTTNAETVLLEEASVASSGEQSFIPRERTTLHLRAVGLMGDHLDEEIVINPFSVRVNLPEELLEPAAPTLSVINNPKLPEPMAPVMEEDADLDPLADLDEDLQRDLRKKWRNRKDGGVLRNLNGWLKNIGK